LSKSYIPMGTMVFSDATLPRSTTLFISGIDPLLRALLMRASEEGLVLVGSIPKRQ